ncbi:MAG: GNAT family N-acetyltransferase [Candidatus Omnitrophica bacterium]|nr:GNAT family N-acetyltransferase [Candidatus Omnitrophota bacterium]
MLISKHHKRIGLKTKVVRKISEIAPQEWQGVFPDVLESYEFFKTLDESGLEQFSFRYIIVYDRKTPVAAAACFLMDYPLDTSISGPLKRLSNSIRKLNPKLLSMKTFICGLPSGRGHIGLAADNDRIMEAILRRMEQLARKNRAPIIVFKDFDHTYTETLAPLQRHGFLKIDSLPTTELDIGFNDFEEHLKTLSAATRYDLRRKFKRVDNSVNIDLEIVDYLKEDVLQEAYQLYLDIVAKHDIGFELMPKDFFVNISKNMPDRTKFFLWRIDGKLVAFLMCLVSKDLLIDYYIGLDYSVAYKYYLYFIKFRDVLNWCIKNKIKRYEMGIACYEPKKRLGFNCVQLYLYIRLRNRLLRPAFNLMCQFLRFENFDPVLKEIKIQKAMP